MTDYEFPETPEIEKAYRAAYKALSALAPGTVTVEPADLADEEPWSKFAPATPW